MQKVIILNTESFGSGDEVLGKKLMGVFLRKLWASQKKPDAIICYNSAVRLMANGSENLDAMTGLFEAGVDILACGTCVDFFKMTESIEVGRVSNMEEIVSIMMQADSVVTV